MDDVVPGLRTAFRQYESDKVLERTRGFNSLREIFSNRENLEIFHETASRRNGNGWSAFFECLFKAVRKEKLASMKKSSGPPAEARLVAYAAFVRSMAERSVLLLAPPPFMKLFSHMTSLLVWDGRILEPVAINYAKALRTLLSHPPHLEYLDPASWRVLMNICWAAILGDRISIDPEWQDAGVAEEYSDDDGSEAEDVPQRRYTIPTSIANEIITLIPILLTSSSAPLVPLPSFGESSMNQPALGLSILHKIHRYISLQPSNSVVPLEIFRALNLVLAELELNCKDQFTAAAIKLFPQLVGIWTSRNKGDLSLREHVLIALRMMLPFVANSSVTEQGDKEVIREAMCRIVDTLAKEAGSRGAVKPLDLETLRFCASTVRGDDGARPFERTAVAAGFGFDASHAINWTAIELYADCCYETHSRHNSVSASAPSISQTQRRKRQRTESSLDKLLNLTLVGMEHTRQLATQVLVFVLDRHWHRIHEEAGTVIKQKLLELLDDDDTVVQSWAFVGLSCLAVIDDAPSTEGPNQAFPMTPSALGSRRRMEQTAWERLWAHATQKASSATLSRVACNAAEAILTTGKVDRSRCVRDVHTLLKNVGIQGPPTVSDASCSFLASCLACVRSDAGLYSANLEDKVLEWFSKTFTVDGASRARLRMGSATPANHLSLLASICNFAAGTIADATVVEQLPDCPVVNRVLEEAETDRLRQVILYSKMPPYKETNGGPPATPPPESATLDADSLNFLDGRPRKLSDMLRATVDVVIEDWAQKDRPTLNTPERLRKSLDLVVLVLTFQACIQVNGLRPDVSGCLQRAASLLDILIPLLQQLSDNIPAQHLVWSGFAPLYRARTIIPDVWPILLPPDTTSGIRHDILPLERYASSVPEPTSDDCNEALLSVVWRKHETRDVLSEVVNAAKDALENIRTPNQGGNGGPSYMDDDEFGPIRNTDADAVPQSFEAKQCQRSTSLLLKTLVDLRLRGPKFASADLRPTADNGLINTLISSDGDRFAQLGFVVCDAVMEGSLRLTVSAVHHLIDEVCYRLKSYAFQRDREMARFVLVFLARSAYLWLLPDSGECERAIDVAAHFVAKAEAGELPCWKVRLQLLLFIDEYLDYEPSFNTWHRMSETEEADVVMGGQPRDIWGPLLVVLHATSDSDARVRFRAASSAAGLHYLSDLPADQKRQAYFDPVERQSKLENCTWDHHLTNTLWKLNTCIASDHYRGATIFHLYEVAAFSPSFLACIQSGLEGVSLRLGLTSPKSLFQPYANDIITSLLATDHLPLSLPPALYGCSTRKELATLCLEMAGASLLSERRNEATRRANHNFFDALCDAVPTSSELATDRHLPLAASIAVASAAADEPDDTDVRGWDSVAKAAVKSLPRDPATLNKFLSANVESVVANLFGLIDLTLGNAEVTALLNRFAKGNPGDIFAMLMAHDGNARDAPPSLWPAISVLGVLRAQAVFKAWYKNMSKGRMVFNALVRLFHAINEAYLVNEQRRYLRCIAILVSLYPNEFDEPTILYEFLRNVVELLVHDDIGQVVLSMLQWGFDKLPNLEKVPPQQVDLLINLGSAYNKLHSNPSLSLVAKRLDTWIISKAKLWQRSEKMVEALPFALVFWPSAWTEHFPHVHEPVFTELAAIAEMINVQDPMALCRWLAAATQTGDKSENNETFLSFTFWFLRQSLASSQWERDGAMAFLNLLYMVNGDVHAPSFNAIKRLTGRTQIIEGARSLSKKGEHEQILRIIVLDKVVKQTEADSYQLRTIAFAVLGMTLPILKKSKQDETKPAPLPPHIHNLLVRLVPGAPPPMPQEPDLNVLVKETNNWVSKGHDHWARELATLLYALVSQDDAFYSCLQPLLDTKGDAATELLPVLVQAVLTCGHTAHLEATMQRVDILSDHFTQLLQSPSAATETIETIIQIILHLRNHKPPWSTGRSGELAYNHWLRIDPLVLSEAAGRCGAFASSLLFLELANDRDDQDGKDLDLSSTRVQKIMYDIYSNVEDPDGFYGIQNNDVMDSLQRRLDHEGQPMRALGYNLAAFEANTASSSSQPLVAALRNFHDLGFNSLAGAVMRSARSNQVTQSNSDPLFLELAWRMGDWDVPLAPELATTSAGRFYAALRAVHRERDHDVARNIVDSAIREEMACLQDIGMERMTEIKKVALNLVCLRDVAQWISAPMQKAINQDDFEGSKVSGFVSLDPSFEFSKAERLSATRQSLIRSARAREDKHLIGDLVTPQSENLAKLEIASHLRLSELARKDGNLQAAVNAITAVRQLDISSSTPSFAAQNEFSQVLWAQGEHGLAIQHVTAFANSLNSEDPKEGGRQAVLHGRAAFWTSLAKLKSAEEIKAASTDAMHRAHHYQVDQREQGQLAHDFAVFADRHYVWLSKSPELERLKSFVVRRQGDIQRLDASLRSTPASTRYIDKDLQELDDERKAKQELDNQLRAYLGHTLQSYATALYLSDEFDDSITRLCSVWLEHDHDEYANQKFAPRLSEIPSHKFIVLGPQLAARLDLPPKRTAFNANLNKLMLRVAQDHPYHILYQVIMLVPYRNPKSRTKTPDTPAGRSAAAKEIMTVLAADQTNGLAREASKQMTYFANMAVDWCNVKHDGAKPGFQLQTPDDCPLRQCRGLGIPVATVVPPVDPERKYANVPTLANYRSTYKLAGGIHRPAIMRCYDTLAQEHVQLFKGEDEVRQDAVMEQVFEMTNRLLKRDRRANVRNLKFRTYTVIALANRTGIIQFVGNTTAIGDWLKDAHARYRLGIDVSADVFRKEMFKIQDRDPNSPKLVAKYQEHMKSFKPVMRHFFTETRRESLAWFTMRLNYARSVAVTSMVGYMVGLGDRHCSNILLDKVTGELVQIDFGIVFDEGAKLRIPEKVPFRLTNDIVDGLGITGVDGTFRQCAEHTLRVLRDSSELILTVLEVFKHDPLYAWAGDPSKLRRAGGGRGSDAAQTSGQDKAERVLARIRQKLGRDLSVEYAVNQLIQEARSTENLAKIFTGWQSWL